MGAIPTRRCTLDLERSHVETGSTLVVGVDEVGRGAWAGPISVGVAAIDGKGAASAVPPGLRDSKRLTESVRESLFDAVGSWCVAWAVGHATNAECDDLGMSAAQRLAASRALDTLFSSRDGCGDNTAAGTLGGSLSRRVFLVDGRWDFVSRPRPSPSEEVAGDANSRAAAGEPEAAGPGHADHIQTVVKGDATCASIAAAALLAKVTRDRWMRSVSLRFPAFSFDRNKGYPSPDHVRALTEFGPTPLHRTSWSYMDRLFGNRT